MSFSEFSIRRPITVAMVCAVAVLLGAISFLRLPVDLMPEIEYPRITVFTQYVGVGPQEIESLITEPIEEALSAVPGVEEITSTSAEGQSRVMIAFNWGEELDEAAAEIRTRIDRLRNVLPEDADPPVIYKFDVSQFPIMFLTVGGNRDPRDLRQFAEDEIQYRLERVPGVAAVDIRGGLRREVHVNLSLRKLRAYDLALRDVVEAIRRENLNEPVGPVKEGEFELLLRTEGEFRSVEDVGEVVIATRQGVPIYVKDIAQIEDSHEEVRQLVRADGQPGIRMFVRKQSGANTVKVAEGVHQEMARINAAFPDIYIRSTMDTSIFIKRSIENVQTAALSGAILAVLVLFLFLRNLRSTFIIALSIPIAVISTFALMYLNNFTLNTMSFGGLALGVGMLVDNAIVVLENIFRHREMGRTPRDASIEGSKEVSTAIVASTLTTIAVFVPLVFLTGMSGIMFMQLSLVVTFALGCSLLVALTVIPVLCSRFLRVRPPQADRHPIIYWLVTSTGRWLNRLDNEYQGLVHWSLDHRRTVILGSALLFVGSLFLVQFVGFELMPVTDEGEVRLNVELPPGTRLEVTNAVAEELEQVIREQVPEAQHILTEVGGGGWRESFTHQADIRVQLVDLDHRDRSSQEIANSLRPHLLRRPGMRAFARTGGSLRIMRMGQSEARIGLEIRGHDLQVARNVADQVKDIIERVPGITEVQISQREGVPEMHVGVDRPKAASMGLNVSNVAETLRTAVGGRVASFFREGGDEYNILVRLQEEDREQLASVAHVPISTPQGQTVPVASLVTMERREGPINIERKDQERLITVSAEYANRDMGSIMAEIDRNLAGWALPEGFSVVYGGEFEEQQKAFGELVFSLILALVLVYMVMAAQFESLRDPLVVLFSIPLAAVGVILTLFLTNTIFNIQAFLGVIMLAGIVVNNAIVLVDYTNLLRRRDGLPLRHAVEVAGHRRLRPILMTTLTTILALVPMSLGFGEGGEVQAPMARVVIGGLLVSTLITLLFIPTLYTTVEERLGRKAKEEAPSRLPGGLQPAR